MIKAGKHAPGWIGHHINSVASNTLEMAEDPNNIKFIKGRKAHFAEHENDWTNPTSGELIDRLSQLGGGVVGFLLVYDATLQSLVADCSICSDPDSASSYINPWNAMVESAAFVEAYARVLREQAYFEAVRKRQEQAEKCGRHGP